MKIERFFSLMKLLFLILSFSLITISCDEGDDEFNDVELDQQAQQNAPNQQPGPATGPQGIMKEKGYCFLLPVPQYVDKADDKTNNGSTLVLLEDGKPLGPAHTPHEEIRQKGQGRYSHWQQFVFFSTSDNSDPMTNGRKYTVEMK